MEVTPAILHKKWRVESEHMHVDVNTHFKSGMNITYLHLRMCIRICIHIPIGVVHMRLFSGTSALGLCCSRRGVSIMH